ncbi:MAG: transglutaminase domain-containing protein [Planctomycetota bacterium]
MNTGILSYHAFRGSNQWLFVLHLALAVFLGGAFGTTGACLACLLITTFVVGIRSRAVTIGSGDPPKEPWRRVVHSILKASVIGASLVVPMVITFVWRMAVIRNDTTVFLLTLIDALAHEMFVISLVLWMIQPKRGNELMLVAGLVMVLMAVAGGGVSTSLTGQTVVGLCVCIGFTVASQTILRHRWAGKDRNRFIKEDASPPTLIAPLIQQPSGRLPQSMWLYQFLAASILLVSLSALVPLVVRVLPEVQTRLYAQLRDRFEETSLGPNLSSSKYVTGSRLGDIRRHLLSDPRAIALRGYCKTPPGYLRGRVFDSFSSNRWRTHRAIRAGSDSDSERMKLFQTLAIRQFTPASLPTRESADGDRRRFRLNVIRSGEYREDDDVAAAAISLAGIVEIYGDPSKGSRVFAPAGSFWIEAKTELVVLDAHGMVQPGVNVAQPYILGVAEGTDPETIDSMDVPLLLRVDPLHRDRLRRAATRICGNATTAREKASRIESHFRQTGTYSLEPTARPKGRDALTHFVDTQHPAHCEFFATAAALMLRCVNVPTRYVTGYVMTTLNDDEEYYIARQTDAHAWVEYFDKEASAWLPLEPTPGRFYRTITLDETAAATIDTGGGMVDDFEGDGARTVLGDLIGWWRSLRTTDALFAVFRYAQIPLLIVLVSWMVFHSRQPDQMGPLAGWIRKRRRWDRRMRRRGLIRNPGETLHQFAKRLEATARKQLPQPVVEELCEAAGWYRAYAEARYRPSNEVLGVAGQGHFQAPR